MSSKSRQMVTGFLMFLVSMIVAVQSFAEGPGIPDVSWVSMSPSTNGAVYALAYYADDIYVGGEFTEVNGVEANNIAKWNVTTSTWSPLIQNNKDRLMDGTTNGVNGVVRALAIYGTDLYVGGSFTTAGIENANCIAKWNTEFSHWSGLNSGMDGAFDVVNALVVNTSNGDVYVGGLFPTAGYELRNIDVPLTVNNIAKIDISGVWSPLGDTMGIVGVNEEVNALAFDGTNLYAGGWFTTAGGVEPITVNYIAKYDAGAVTPVWSPLLAEGQIVPGTSGAVNALAFNGSYLYVGGSFATAGELPANNIAAWDGYILSWSTLGEGTNGAVNALAFDRQLVGKGSFGSRLFVGGAFTSAGGVSVSNIASYDGGNFYLRTQSSPIQWSALGSGVNNTVRTLALFDNTTVLYVGGNFTVAGGKSSMYLAKISIDGSTVPDAPTNISAERNVLTAKNDGQINVSFITPPSFISDVTLSYTLTYYPGGVEILNFVSGTVVTGLSNTTAYTFKVTAINALGKSPISAASNSVTPATVPDAPVIGTAVRGNGQVTVNFTAPKFNGGSAILDYTVTTSPAGIAIVTKATSPITVDGLTYNLPYTFTVTARNQYGSGISSESSVSVTPTGAVPGAPTGVYTERGGSGQLIVYFTAPSANGSPVTGYTVTSYYGNMSVPGSPSGTTISGLTNGTPYAFRVTATNGIGTGPISSFSPWLTPAVVPGVPTNVTATAGILQATIAFSAPLSNGGMPITGYTLTSVTPSGISITKTASPIIVTGLRNTLYTFQLTANNVVGSSLSTAPFAVTPNATKPGAPTDVIANRGNGQVIVGFIPPKSNGGSPILYYTVTSNPATKLVTASGITAGPITFTGLKNGTAYSFNVSATNGPGTGPASAWSPAVTPATVPFAPIIGTPVKGNGQVYVYFSAPAAVPGIPGNGGSPITSYTVTTSPGGIDAVTKPASPILVTGLTSGSNYQFSVTATNVLGTSIPSGISAIAIPTSGVPGIPTAVTAIASTGSVTFNSAGSAIVSFVPPLANGSSITEYSVISFPATRTVTGSGISGSPITFPDLKNGTAYTFRILATNSKGTSSTSVWSPYVTPTTIPNAPTIGTAVRGNAQATVNFVIPPAVLGIPGNGGSPITSYIVTSSPSGITATKAASPIIVTGLENGIAYTFTAVAINTLGSSASSSDSNSVIPATVPGIPNINNVIAGSGQAIVYFTEPVINGGMPVTGYTVTASPGGKTGTTGGNGSAITVFGLTNGTAYTFTVKATNVIGTGLASVPSNSVSVGPLTTVSAAANTTVYSKNGGTPLETFTPVLGTTAYRGVTAYYGVNAITTGSIGGSNSNQWKIVVQKTGVALTRDMATITEKGWYDVNDGAVGDSAYSTEIVNGTIVFSGNFDWNTKAGDNFTNVDDITFNDAAPLGSYTISRTLYDHTTGLALSNPYVLTKTLADTVTVSAAANTNVYSKNGGNVLRTFLPVLGASVKKGTVAYYGVKALTYANPSDQNFWMITVRGAGALTTDMVTITEKGWYDASNGAVEDSSYSKGIVSGSIVFSGNNGWNTKTGDNFTNVDGIIFNSSAPAGFYTITRGLYDYNSGGAPKLLSNFFVKTVTVTP